MSPLNGSDYLSSAPSVSQSLLEGIHLPALRHSQEDLDRGKRSSSSFSSSVKCEFAQDDSICFPVCSSVYSPCPVIF